MQYLEEFLTAPDDHEIPVRVWRPKQVDAVLVIAHGMAEYCERYAPLAEWLTEHNIAVMALNHRGHGMDCSEDELGYFADNHGWQLVVDDLHQAVEFIQKEIPKTPISLFGHSMGSFIAQAYIQQYGSSIKQLLLSSTNRVNRPKILVSQVLISFIKFYKGKKSTSTLVDFLSFGVFNKKFKPTRTEHDWLSRDKEHVDAYEADPYCGFSCRLLMWQDFLNGLLTISPKNWPTELPIHFLSGSQDSVGEFGRGVGQLANTLKDAGKNVATFKLYSGARHELTNEINADEVWDDIKKIVLTGKL